MVLLLQGSPHVSAMLSGGTCKWLWSRRPWTCQSSLLRGDTLLRRSATLRATQRKWSYQPRVGNGLNAEFKAAGISSGDFVVKRAIMSHRDICVILFPCCESLWALVLFDFTLPVMTEEMRSLASPAWFPTLSPIPSLKQGPSLDPCWS